MENPGLLIIISLFWGMVAGILITLWAIRQDKKEKKPEEWDLPDESSVTVSYKTDGNSGFMNFEVTSGKDMLK